MFKAVLRNFRLTKRRKNLDNLKEQVEWRKALDESRRKHHLEFWEIQTEVENEWLTSYNKALMKKYYRRQTKHRDSVIKISQRTQELIDERAEKIKQKENLRKSIESENWKDVLRKKELMDILNIESKKWITLDNYKERVTETLIIPENLDHSSYYTHLRDLSVIAGLEKIVPSAEDFNNRDETNAKNSLLVPAFSDVRSYIKRISYSPLQPLVEDYHASKSRLYNYPSKIEKIKQAYQNVLESWKAKESMVSIFLDRMMQQTDLLVLLVESWNRYIQIAKLDDAEVRLGLDNIINDLPERIFFDIDKSDDQGFHGNQDFQEPNPETSDAIDHLLSDLKVPKPEPTETSGSQSSDYEGYDGEKRKRKSKEGESSEESQSEDGIFRKNGNDKKNRKVNSDMESSSQSEVESSQDENEIETKNQDEDEKTNNGLEENNIETKSNEKNNEEIEKKDENEIEKKDESEKKDEIENKDENKTKKKLEQIFEYDSEDEDEDEDEKETIIDKYEKLLKKIKSDSEFIPAFKYLIKIIKTLNKKTPPHKKKFFNVLKLRNHFENEESFLYFLSKNKTILENYNIHYIISDELSMEIKDYEETFKQQYIDYHQIFEGFPEKDIEDIASEIDNIKKKLKEGDEDSKEDFNIDFDKIKNEDFEEIKDEISATKEKASCVENLKEMLEKGEITKEQYDERMKTKAYLGYADDSFIKILKNLHDNSENYSEFDMYEGTFKDLADAKSRDINENIKKIGKIISKNTSNSKEDDPKINLNEQKEEMKIDDFCFNPTFAVLKMKDKISNIDESKLSQNRIDMKYKILINLEKLNNMKIIEPHMLAKVYKHHRYDPPKFD
jgi:hypothetical protein